MLNEPGLLLTSDLHNVMMIRANDEYHQLVFRLGRIPLMRADQTRLCRKPYSPTCVCDKIWSGNGRVLSGHRQAAEFFEFSSLDMHVVAAERAMHCRGEK
jgi:hypothetical protein